MHVHITTFQGNPNVGLYGFVNDNFCIVGNTVSDTEVATLHKVLKVPIHQMNICGTPLVGIFISGNNDVIFVPDAIFESEEELLKKANINYVKVPTVNTALGNNMALNQNGCLVNPEFEEEALEVIKQSLSIPVQKASLAHVTTVGALIAHNDKGCLVSHDATDEEVNMVEDTFKVPCGIGTLNFGSGFISSGILCNSHGFIVGKSSTGIEITNVDETLGFLDG